MSTKRKRRVWPIASFAAAMSLVVVGGWWWLSGNDPLSPVRGALPSDPQRASELFAVIEQPEQIDVIELLEVGKAAYACGAAALADQVLSAANRPGPMRGDVLRMLISVNYEQDEFDKVLAACEQLGTLTPYDSFPWLVAAGIHHEQERVSEALIAYRQALKSNLPVKELARVRYQVADLSLFIGDLDGSRRMMDLLLKQNQVPPEARLLNARLLRREGQQQAAIEAVKRVLVDQPDRPDALLLHAELLMDANELDQAAAKFQQVVQLDPYSYQAHYQFGQTLARLGKTEAAEVHLTRSRELTDLMSEVQAALFHVRQQPKNRLLQLKLSQLLEKQGDTQRAEYWREMATK